MSTLAIDGGVPVRTRPFPMRAPFSGRDTELVSAALRSQNLYGPTGTFVERFRAEFARLFGVRHAVAASSGTGAIHAALGAIDLEPGDEVITAPITDAGTIIPILYQLAVPIFADVNDTYNLDPSDVERHVTERTRAILVVHLFGNPCDMDAIMSVARRHNLAVIEDASQAHLSAYRGRWCGTIGDIGAFSFQQSKHLTTGDGGMAITDQERYWNRLDLFVDKGWARRDWGARNYLFLAPNYRMTELQGAVGLAQLERLTNVTETRTALGTYLSELIRDIDGVIPAPVTEGGTHTYWQYPLRVTRGEPDRIALALNAEGIPASSGYIRRPIFQCSEALRHLQTFGQSHMPFHPAFTSRTIDYDSDLCPRAQKMLNELIMIPIHEQFSRDDISDIACALRKVMEAAPFREV